MNPNLDRLQPYPFQKLNKLFARPLVATWAGGKSRGGASLTKLGEKLIESYDTVVEQSVRVNRAVLTEIGRSVAREKTEP